MIQKYQHCCEVIESDVQVLSFILESKQIIEIRITPLTTTPVTSEFRRMSNNNVVVLGLPDFQIQRAV